MAARMPDALETKLFQYFDHLSSSDDWQSISHDQTATVTKSWVGTGSPTAKRELDNKPDGITDGFHGFVIRFSIRIAAWQQGTVSQVYFFYGVVLNDNRKTVLSHVPNL